MNLVDFFGGLICGIPAGALIYGLLFFRQHTGLLNDAQKHLDRCNEFLAEMQREVGKS